MVGNSTGRVGQFSPAAMGQFYFATNNDGHTLARAIEQVERITGGTVQRSFVDRGYRGHKVKDPQVLILTAQLLKRPKK